MDFLYGIFQVPEVNFVSFYNFFDIYEREHFKHYHYKKNKDLVKPGNLNKGSASYKCEIQ